MVLSIFSSVVLVELGRTELLISVILVVLGGTGGGCFILVILRGTKYFW